MSVQTLVVAVAEVPGIDRLVACRSDEDPAHTERSGRAGVAGTKNSPVVHLAVAGAAIHVTGTMLDPAFLAHVSKVAATSDRSMAGR